jgi:hypothetical protein
VAWDLMEDHKVEYWINKIAFPYEIISDVMFLLFAFCLCVIFVT